MDKEQLLGLATGWRLPEDEKGLELYLGALERYSASSTREEFVDFILEIRDRGKRGTVDYIFAVYPAVRSFLNRFGETPGRLLVGFMEASNAGEEEDETRFITRLMELTPDDRTVNLLFVLHSRKPPTSDMKRVDWELEQLSKIENAYPSDPIVGEVRKRLTETKRPIGDRSNEDLWNKIFGLVWKEYERNLPKLLLG